ncbi:MAG: hypothetical protein KGS45_09740 [Planctomycetes bacterium]|nr:hypothetical protein [Planctomycetota bacterium]
MARVYLETTVLSAIVTDRLDLASLYRRESSRKWMQEVGPEHELFTSVEVIRELSDPRFPLRVAALEHAEQLPLLEINDEVIACAQMLVTSLVMPQPVAGDALHVAVCAVHGIDYLLSWNVKHLSNPNKVPHLRSALAEMGLDAPAILTPDML